MDELRARLVENFFRVYRRGSRRWDVEIEEVDCCGIVHKRAEEQRNM
jgi:hypothetical protein